MKDESPLPATRRPRRSVFHHSYLAEISDPSIIVRLLINKSVSDLKLLFVAFYELMMGPVSGPSTPSAGFVNDPGGGRGLAVLTI
jgi:hypothetical protein